VTDIAEAVVQVLTGPVTEAVPVIAASIPPGPAAELGRIGAPPDAAPSVAAGFRGAVAARGQVRGGVAEPAKSPVLSALSSVGPLLAERLLGALELTVSALDMAGVPELAPNLGHPQTGLVVIAQPARDSQAVTAAALLERLRPGAADLVASLTRQLASHPLVVPLLVVPPDVTDEASIAAAHGRAHLALAVAAASAVIGQQPLPGLVDSPAAAVVGVAVGTAVLALRRAPMPAGYAAALFDKARREYLLPRSTSGSVPVAGHRFALVEGEVPEAVDFSGNGLAAVVPGGVVIRAGTAEGSVPVLLKVFEQPPPLDVRAWDEVVEVSWRAAAGLASVTGPGAPDAPGAWRLRRATPPWPGDYRLRVHARGRDDADEGEGYELAVWQAPAAPEIVHKRTDQLGYRLRGEPVPTGPEPPERAYRWVRRSALSMAATVTVVTGSTAEDVLRAFGADPAQPESLRRITDDVTARMSVDPWVAVLAAGTAVLAVEDNGFQGTDGAVLRRASAGGRAASMFWNVNAMTRLSFAEGGQVLASFEPPEGINAGSAVGAALEGLDFHDYRNKEGKGLVAVERFTGRGITEQDLEQIHAADIAFRIMPRP
jgi:hypothetical protein